MSDRNRAIIEEFRANDGKVGGPFEGAHVLLLHTTGARSGLERTNPVMYLPDKGRYIVFASKAGADTNPDWYHNLRANPQVRIEVGTETLEAKAEVIEGTERDGTYARQSSLFPAFRHYQEGTSRMIPVIALTPIS